MWMNECQDRQIDRYIPPMWTSTKHPSVCVAFIVLDRGRAMNSARQQCLFLCISAGTEREPGTGLKGLLCI